MTGWMDKAMDDLRPWIGRVRVVEDDIGLMAVRRAAGAFDMDPESFKIGSELPPHWFGIFFTETVRQSDIGPDGHPNKGIVLPPIPMPRRMGAGRRVKVMGNLRAGEPAVKKAEVADIVPKSGRSGDIFVLTMRHTIEQAGKTIAVDTFDAIYRPAVPPGQKTTATIATPARGGHAWSETTKLANTLNFRYGGLTWNAPGEGDAGPRPVSRGRRRRHPLRRGDLEPGRGLGRPALAGGRAGRRPAGRRR